MNFGFLVSGTWISDFRIPESTDKQNYPNFGIRITIHGSAGSRSLDKGGGRSLPQIFAALGASVWPKNKGELGPRTPPLDPPLHGTKSCF